MQNISQYWLMNNKIPFSWNFLNTVYYLMCHTMISIKIEFVRNMLDIVLKQFDSNIRYIIIYQ